MPRATHYIYIHIETGDDGAHLLYELIQTSILGCGILFPTMSESTKQ